MKNKTFIKIIIAMGIALAILTGIALIDNEILNGITFYGILIAVSPLLLSAWYFNRYSTGRYWYIFKGWSYSNLFYYIPFFNKNEFYFYFSIFSENFISDKDLEGKTEDEKVRLRNQINKLCGASFGGIHDNSIRLGFNWEKNDPTKVQLFNYTYNGGKRVHDSSGREPYIGDIQMDLTYRCMIKLDRVGNKAIIVISENVSGKMVYEHAVAVDASKFKKNGRMAFPYVENNPKRMKFDAQYVGNK